MSIGGGGTIMIFECDLVENPCAFFPPNYTFNQVYDPSCRSDGITRIHSYQNAISEGEKKMGMEVILPTRIILTKEIPLYHSISPSPPCGYDSLFQ